MKDSEDMRGFTLLLTIVVALLGYRIYVVMNRPIPEGISQPNAARVLDELGRICKFLMDACVTLDINPASPPIKYIVNKGFGILMNGIYRQNTDVRVSNSMLDNVPVTVIQPLKATKTLPAIIYIHGGGWTWFSTDSYLSYLENLANRTQMVIFAIEYRKAPEYPFPSGYVDCIAATRQILTGKSGVNIDVNKVLVAGEGSGGNLAAAVARFFPTKIMIQILINPSLQLLDFRTPSYLDNSDILPGITSPEMEAYHWLLYLSQPLKFAAKMVEDEHVYSSTVQTHWKLIDSEKHLPKYLNLTRRKTSVPRKTEKLVAYGLENYVTNETLSPMMHRSLNAFPNAYVITSHYDVLRDEAVMFTVRMHEDGTRIKLKHYRDSYHGFFLFSHDNGFICLEDAKSALQELVEFLNAKVHGRSIELREEFQG